MKKINLVKKGEDGFMYKLVYKSAPYWRQENGKWLISWDERWERVEKREDGKAY